MTNSCDIYVDMMVSYHDVLIMILYDISRSWCFMIDHDLSCMVTNEIGIVSNKLKRELLWKPKKQIEVNRLNHKAEYVTQLDD